MMSCAQANRRWHRDAPPSSKQCEAKVIPLQPIVIGAVLALGVSAYAAWDRPGRRSRPLSHRSLCRRVLLRAVLGDGRQHGQYDTGDLDRIIFIAAAPPGSGATCGPWSWHSPHTAFSMRSTAPRAQSRRPVVVACLLWGVRSHGGGHPCDHSASCASTVESAHRKSGIAIMGGWRLPAMPLASENKERPRGRRRDSYTLCRTELNCTRRDRCPRRSKWESSSERPCARTPLRAFYRPREHVCLGDDGPAHPRLTASESRAAGSHHRGHRWPLARARLQNLLYTPSFETHAHRFLSAGRWLNIQFSARWFGEWAPRPAIFRAVATPTRRHDGELGIATRRGDPRARNAVSRFAIEGALLLLLTDLSRLPIFGERRRPRWFKIVEDAIESSIAEPPSVSELAALAGVHASHLLRTFRHGYGCTSPTYAPPASGFARDPIAAWKTAALGSSLDAGFADPSRTSPAGVFRQLRSEHGRIRAIVGASEIRREFFRIVMRARDIADLMTSPVNESPRFTSRESPMLKTKVPNV